MEKNQVGVHRFEKWDQQIHKSRQRRFSPEYKNYFETKSFVFLSTAVSIMLELALVELSGWLLSLNLNTILVVLLLRLGFSLDCYNRIKWFCARPIFNILSDEIEVTHSPLRLPYLRGIREKLAMFIFVRLFSTKIKEENWIILS